MLLSQTKHAWVEKVCISRRRNGREFSVRACKENDRRSPFTAVQKSEILLSVSAHFHRRILRLHQTAGVLFFIHSDPNGTDPTPTPYRF
jgi:hypothetical protein